jgi:hypothetical protein
MIQSLRPKEIALLRRAVLLLTVLASSAALAKGTAAGVIRFHPPADPEERPLPVEIYAAPQGSDYALRVEFDKLPWGEQCKRRCANATIFLDTDDNRRTGLDLGPKSKETGADLAITVSGERLYREHSADTFLKVRVRRLSAVASVGQGDTLAELDHRHDPERVQSDGTRVYARIDGTDSRIPTAKRMRVIYHPPGSDALQTTTAGMLASGRVRNVQVFRKGVEERPRHHRK